MNTTLPLPESESCRTGPLPVQTVRWPGLAARDVILNVLRLDLIDPGLSGNKWFKLKYNLQHILEAGGTRVLSFGGAWSNHLHALAVAGRRCGLDTIGVVRGELPESLNPVLAAAREQGMELVPVSRGDYRRRHEAGFSESLRLRYRVDHVLPEGGSNLLALKGCAEIADLLRWQSERRPRYLALPCGTGATMAGLLRGLPRRGTAVDEVLGIAVLKGRGYLAAEVSRWLGETGGQQTPPWAVLDDYHCGGYARSNPQLATFLREFRHHNELPLEPVYSGKLLHGLVQAVSAGRIQAGSEVLALHTGGIHPWRVGADVVKN